jgi:hypothetical protein
LPRQLRHPLRLLRPRRPLCRWYRSRLPRYQYPGQARWLRGHRPLCPGPDPGPQVSGQGRRVLVFHTARVQVSQASRTARVLGSRTFRVSRASTCDRAGLDRRIAAPIRPNLLDARALMGRWT